MEEEDHMDCDELHANIESELTTGTPIEHGKTIHSACAQGWKDTEMILWVLHLSIEQGWSEDLAITCKRTYENHNQPICPRQMAEATRQNA
jgi:hypothetical protein